MRKYYNIMCGLCFMIFAVMYSVGICLDYALGWGANAPILVILSLFCILLLLMLLWFERHEYKLTVKAYCGKPTEESSCIPVKQVKKELKQIFGKIEKGVSVFALLVGIVSLFLYDPVSRVFILITTLLIFYSGVFYKGEQINAVAYITSQKKRIRRILIRIHDMICEENLKCDCYMSTSIPFLNYAVSTNYNVSKIIFGVQVWKKENKICIYSESEGVFRVFSDRLAGYPLTEKKGILFPADAVDYKLIKEIFLFNVEELRKEM